jgi:23S rRNA (uracil-5-)-methyltransferase RumA
MKPGTQLTLTADRLDDEGRGVGVAGGRAVHVAGLLPGETGTIAIEHVSPHRPQAFAALLARRGPDAADRVAPACPAHGRCGGCALQALAPAAQLEAKRRRVADALRPVLGDVEVPAPIAAPASLGYRNRGTYVVGGAAGALTLGAYAPASHDLVDTIGCRIVAPAIDRVARAARDALDASGLAPYDERRGGGALRYVVVRAARDGRALVALVTPPDAPRAPLDVAAAAIARAVPEVVGVVWVRNGATSSAVLADDRELLHGRATLPETIAGVAVELEIGAFTQVSLDAGERLTADLAARLARPGLAAIELHSGVGAIGFALAARGVAVVGVERNPGAVAAANAAAAGAALPGRARFVAGEAGDLLGALAATPCDVLIVNPPRRGLDAPTLAAVHARRPATVAYVSCEPSTLARDLAGLLADGYAVTSIQPYDLMPGAAPIETVVVLERRPD